MCVCAYINRHMFLYTSVCAYMHTCQATSLIASVTILCSWLRLVIQRGRCTCPGHCCHWAIQSFCKGTTERFGKWGLLWARGALRGLRQDAQPLTSKLAMWIMSQLQIIFTWEHCLLIMDNKDNRGIWSFCIRKQCCVWAPHNYSATYLY